MSSSASAADERVLDVQFTDDPISVNLRDGRVITVPLVWYPRLLESTPRAALLDAVTLDCRGVIRSRLQSLNYQAPVDIHPSSRTHLVPS